MKVDFDRGLLKRKATGWLLVGWRAFHASDVHVDELMLMAPNLGERLRGCSLATRNNIQHQPLNVVFFFVTNYSVNTILYDLLALRGICTYNTFHSIFFFSSLLRQSLVWQGQGCNALEYWSNWAIWGGLTWGGCLLWGCLCLKTCIIRIYCWVILNCFLWRVCVCVWSVRLRAVCLHGGNDEDISLFSMRRSAGREEDGHIKAFNNVLNMDCSRRVGP